MKIEILPLSNKFANENNKRFVVTVQFMHGDASADTEEEFTGRTVKEIEPLIRFLTALDATDAYSDMRIEEGDVKSLDCSFVADGDWADENRWPEEFRNSVAFQWPGDCTNDGNTRAKMEGFHVSYYDENNDRHDVKITI